MYIFFECVLFTFELDFQAVQLIQFAAITAAALVFWRLKK